MIIQKAYLFGGIEAAGMRSVPVDQVMLADEVYLSLFSVVEACRGNVPKE